MVVESDERVRVVSLGPDGAGLVSLIGHHAVAVLQPASRFAWEILRACRCARGCPKCLHLALRAFRLARNPQASKSEVLRLAATLLERDQGEIDSWVRYHEFGEAGGAFLRKALIRERDTAKDLITASLGIAWPAVDAEFRSVPKIEASASGFAGRFAVRSGDPPLIEIADGMPAAATYSVVAHELAHHWQFADANFDIAGFAEFAVKQRVDERRYLEGFADWVAFRASDVFGLSVAACQIATNPDSRYGDGMRWWMRLEAAVGAGRTIALAAGAKGALSALEAAERTGR